MAHTRTEMTLFQATQVFCDAFPALDVCNVKLNQDDDGGEGPLDIWWSCEVYDRDGLVATALMDDHWPEVHVHWRP